MDDDQQFCLRWNNHQSTLISVFDTLLENGTLVDCTLAAEGKFLKAHKVVLSACSPYFAALLSQQYDKHPIFILKDVKFQELRAMMDYMYRGEVNISQDQLAALLKAAESLQIKGLSDSRGGSNNSTNTPSQAHKSDVKQHIPVPPKASGLTIENKRPLLRTDFDADVSGSREGSVSPSTRKRKKVNQRRKSLAETNNLLDNHDQHSNSSSHSNNQQQQQLSTSATSAPTNNLSVTNNKKTEQDGNNQEHDEEIAHNTKRLKQTTDDSDNNKQDSELMIEPKNEYDDDDEDDDNVEDLTMDDEMLDDLDQAGPSHGGEGSSQGYHWQMDGRNQESQEGSGQHRDAQGDGASDTNTTINLDKYFYFPENNSEYSQHNFKIALPTLPEAKTPQQSQQESWIDYTSVHSSISTGNNGIDDDIELPPLTEIKQEKIDEDYEVHDIPVWHTAKSTAKITMYPTKENTRTPVRRKLQQIQPKPPVLTPHVMQLPPLTQIHKTKPKLIAVAVKKIVPIQPKPTNLPQLTQIQSPTKTINIQQTLSTSPDSKLIIKKISQNVVNTRRHSTGNSSKIVPTKELLESLKQENIIYQDNEDKPWYCKTCGRNYKWRNSLKQHIKNECGVPPKYHCVRKCGYKTHIHSNLKRHLNSKFCKPSSPAEQSSEECLQNLQSNDENI